MEDQEIPHTTEALVARLHQLCTTTSGPVADRLQEVEELLQRCPGIINQRGSRNHPAIHTAAENDEHQVMEVLIRQGADIEALGGSHSVTPLICAITRQAQRCFKLLIEKGANVRAVGGDKKCVLQVAVEQSRDNGGMVAVLLDQGASLQDKEPKSGHTPVHTATLIGDPEVLQLLLRHCPDAANIIDNRDNTPLHLAAEKGHRDCCSVLLKFGANMAACNKLKETPLHLAVRASFKSTCEMLLSKCENINSKDNNGDTPLICSAASQKHSSKDILELILQYKPDVNITNSNGDNALHVVAKRGYHEKCWLLVAAGADCNYRNQAGLTPLHYATKKKFPECCAAILNLPFTDDPYQSSMLKACDKQEDRGNVINDCVDSMSTTRLADVNITSKEGKTPLHYSLEKGSVECCMLLLKRRAKVVLPTLSGDTPLHLAAYAGLDECCRHLIQKGASVNAVNNLNRTPLHLAAQRGSLLCCQVLQKRGANVNLSDSDKMTPLHIAAKIGVAECCTFLIKKNAKLSATDKNGMIPLHWAASEGHLGCCKEMITEENYWQLFKMDDKGQTPLVIAFTKRHDDIFCYLLQKMCDPKKSKRSEAHKFSCLNEFLTTSINDKRNKATEAIVNSQQWEKAFAPTEAKERSMNLEQLIRKFPKLVKVVLDKCIKCVGGDQETFVFYLLDDTYYSLEGNLSGEGNRRRLPYCDDGTLRPDALMKAPDEDHWRQHHPLNIMVECQELELLKHRLCQRLMREKWDRYVATVFYCLLLLSAAFVLALSGYVTVACDWDYVEKAMKVSQDMVCGCLRGRRVLAADLGASACPSTSSPTSVPETVLVQSAAHRLIRLITLFLLLLRVVIEACKLQHLRGTHLRTEKTVQAVCYVTATVLLVDWTECTAATGDWQWCCGVVSVLLAWYELILLLGMMPQFGVYLFILNDFLKTILKLFGLMFLQVVAFTFAFHMLMRGNYAFNNFPRAIMKILTMMLGDLSYDDHFSNTESPLPYPTISNLLLLCFLAVMVIGMINLVTNLPQGELEKAKDEAQLINLSSRVNLLLAIESWFPALRKRYTVGWVTERVQQDKIQDVDSGASSSLTSTNSPCRVCCNVMSEQTHRLVEDLVGQIREQNMILEELRSRLSRDEEPREPQGTG
nr:transient receptor potential cation channel subfamily A member 1 homolog isoform X2 [Procambarus clarkii]